MRAPLHHLIAGLLGLFAVMVASWVAPASSCFRGHADDAAAIQACCSSKKTSPCCPGECCVARNPAPAAPKSALPTSPSHARAFPVWMPVAWTLLSWEIPAPAAQLATESRISLSPAPSLPLFLRDGALLI